MHAASWAARRGAGMPGTLGAWRNHRADEALLTLVEGDRSGEVVEDGTTGTWDLIL